MIMGRILNKVINIFTGLFAITTLVLMLVFYINNAFGGIMPESSALTLERTRNYFMLATIFCAGTEFTLKRSLVLAVIFACIVIAVACFMIYTDVSVL